MGTGTIFGVIGSTSGISLVFVTPSLILMKLRKIHQGRNWFSKGNIPAWTVIVVGLIAGGISLGVSVQTLVQNGLSVSDTELCCQTRIVPPQLGGNTSHYLNVTDQCS